MEPFRISLNDLPGDILDADEQIAVNPVQADSNQVNPVDVVRISLLNYTADSLPSVFEDDSLDLHAMAHTAEGKASHLINKAYYEVTKNYGYNVNLPVDAEGLREALSKQLEHRDWPAHYTESMQESAETILEVLQSTLRTKQEQSPGLLERSPDQTHPIHEIIRAWRDGAELSCGIGPGEDTIEAPGEDESYDSSRAEQIESVLLKGLKSRGMADDSTSVDVTIDQASEAGLNGRLAISMDLGKPGRMVVHHGTFSASLGPESFDEQGYETLGGVNVDMNPDRLGLDDNLVRILNQTGTYSPAIADFYNDGSHVILHRCRANPDQYRAAEKTETVYIPVGETNPHERLQSVWSTLKNADLDHTFYRVASTYGMSWLNPKEYGSGVGTYNPDQEGSHRQYDDWVTSVDDRLQGSVPARLRNDETFDEYLKNSFQEGTAPDEVVQALQENEQGTSPSIEPTI